jgi:hypothetical protein
MICVVFVGQGVTLKTQHTEGVTIQRCAIDTLHSTFATAADLSPGALSVKLTGAVVVGGVVIAALAFRVLARLTSGQEQRSGGKSSYHGTMTPQS